MEIGKIYVSGGAIKADNVWYIGDNYVFTTAINIAGLPKDLAIAKSLGKEGITAGTQVKTKTVKDFFLEDDHFYVSLNRIKGAYLTQRSTILLTEKLLMKSIAMETRKILL